MPVSLAGVSDFEYFSSFIRIYFFNFDQFKASLFSRHDSFSHILISHIRVVSYTFGSLHIKFQLNRMKTTKVVQLYLKIRSTLTSFWPVWPVDMTQVVKDYIHVVSFTFGSLHNEF